MDNNKNADARRSIECQEWWKKYSAMVRAQYSQADSMPASSGSGYIGSGSGSLGIRYIGSGSGSLGIRYIGSGSGSLGIRYIGSGSGSLGIRYIGSGVISTEVSDSNVDKKVEETVIDVTNLTKKEANSGLDPYAVYPRSRFPGEGSGSDNGNGILAYGLGLI